MSKNNKTESSLYGLMAEFETAEELVAAARRAHAEGYREMDAYSPFPIEGLAEAMHVPRNPLPRIVLLGGIIGCLVGFLMQYYAAVIDYPLNVGGRPFNSWPSFIPITFEVTILIAAFSAVLGMFALNGLPMPHHPVFNVPRFEQASQDRFFLCIETQDPKFDPTTTKHFLEELHPFGVYEVAQ
ncbi:MAG: DUF3341 domain-containing protein [candidate division KSB1 bacterium]|nr:DUF3341 domain-containing protein [candidate division KSB1 bacterium]MDZ7300798.1 DUF3341 domain-containing protein [candidate division KSB1 bacterium]MDZ7309931.1 DUF3341 domain-containing protein [candidate division KSB1 bacterium]